MCVGVCACSRVDGWVNKWGVVQECVSVSTWMDGRWMDDGRMDGQIDGHMDEWMDRWVGGRVVGWMDG